MDEIDLGDILRSEGAHSFVGRAGAPLRGERVLVVYLDRASLDGT